MRRKVNLPGNNTITLVVDKTIGYMTWFHPVSLKSYSFGEQRTFRLVCWRFFYFDVIWNEVDPYW